MCPSKTNFIFITHPKRAARDLYRALRERGILVRYFDAPRIGDYLRVSIGTSEEMETFCAVMTKLVEGA